MNETKEMVADVSTTTKKELGRKFFVFLVWLVLVVIVAVLIGMGRIGEPILEKALDNFFIVSVTYIGGNVLQKGTRYVAEAIKSKVEEGEK